MDANDLFSRRAVIASAPGGALFLASWLKAGQKPLDNYQPKFFSPEEFSALQAYTEILIPSDETPGAREAHCAHYIDFVLKSSDDAPQTQTAWRKAMSAIKETGFFEAAPARQLELVTQMAQPEVSREAAHPAYFAYRLIKQQTAFAFYTSKEGTIQTLDYKGNSYNMTFPACTHPEHKTIA